MTTYGLDGKPKVRADLKPKTEAQKKAAKARGKAATAKAEKLARMRREGFPV